MAGHHSRIPTAYTPGDPVILRDDRRRYVVVGPPANGRLRSGYQVIQDDSGMPMLAAEAAIVHADEYEPDEPVSAMEVLDRVLDRAQAELDPTPDGLRPVLGITGDNLIRALQQAGYRVLPR